MTQEDIKRFTALGRAECTANDPALMLVHIEDSVLRGGPRKRLQTVHSRVVRDGAEQEFAARNARDTGLLRRPSIPVCGDIPHDVITRMDDIFARVIDRLEPSDLDSKGLFIGVIMGVVNGTVGGNASEFKFVPQEGLFRCGIFPGKVLIGEHNPIGAREHGNIGIVRGVINVFGPFKAHAHFVLLNGMGLRLSKLPVGIHLAVPTFATPFTGVNIVTPGVVYNTPSVGDWIG